MNEDTEKNPKKTKLNLGCGEQILEGFINIDSFPHTGVDLVCDLNKGIPLPDNSITEVKANHILEHLEDIIKIMEEIHRVSKKGAVVKIKSPYFKSIGAFKDPSHKSFLTERTFEYFDPLLVRSKRLPNYQTKAAFSVKKVSFIWSSPYIRFLPFKKSFFIKYFWNIARTIYYELEVIK